jgi:hypothetical protein
MSLPPVGAGFQWDYVFDWTIMKYQHQQPRIPPALDSTQREVRRTPQDEERERHGSSFNRTAAPGAEGSRRRYRPTPYLSLIAVSLREPALVGLRSVSPCVGISCWDKFRLA